MVVHLEVRVLGVRPQWVVWFGEKSCESGGLGNLERLKGLQSL